jgi:Ser-tRNA(Ala) deacylase AlaX
MGISSRRFHECHFIMIKNHHFNPTSRLLPIMATELLYLKDMSLLSSPAQVIAIDPLAKTVTLNRTPFYPQGGGQPSDRGTLKSSTDTFDVTAVKKSPATGDVLHFLSSVVGLETGQTVETQVDAETRNLHTRSHSAGHLLDHAIEDLALPFEVRSAYHFLPSPYVEYAIVDPSIDISPEYLKSLSGNLETAANSIVAEAIPVQVYNSSVSELSPWRQKLIPEAVKQSGNVRLVKFDRAGLLPVPCSGTHVNNSSQIKPIRIKKISVDKEKRTIRVTYLLS